MEKNKYFGFIMNFRNCTLGFAILMFMTFRAESQTSNLIDAIKGRFNEYVKAYPMEEIYTMTDRQQYVAGESMWLRFFSFNRQSLKLLSGNGIVYFEILNPENRPVIQRRFRLTDGNGSGQLVLPDSLSSGYYTVRAYTNWMKNFMPWNCFVKKITVYNALNGKNLSAKSTEFQSAAETQSGFTSSVPGLKVSHINDMMTVLQIRTNQEYRSRNGILYYLFIQTRGTINYTSPVSLTGDIVDVAIPQNILPQGINQITLFNVYGKLVNEIYNFTPVKKNIEPQLSVDENIKVRQKVSVDIDLKKNADTDVTNTVAGFSVSIKGGGDLFPDIEDYLIFGSEFSGVPEKVLINPAPDVLSDTLNNYLSVIRSNWINWESILTGTIPDIRYDRETKNHFISGKLVNKSTGGPDTGRYVFMSVPGKDAYFQYAQTDRNGEFSFSLPIDDNYRDLIIQPEEPERNNSIEIENSFSIKYTGFVRSKDSTLSNVPDDIASLGINYQVMKIYSSDEIPDVSSQVDFKNDWKRFYGKPDIELVMDDYIKLPVMQEVFFELMPGVFLKKRKTEYEITILDPIENRYYDKPPTLFVDGVFIKDPAIIANLDPELVEKIDAVKARYFIGDYMFYGIVNVITRAGDFSHFTIPDYAVRLSYRATEPSRAFQSIDYSGSKQISSHLPDFRNTLYWNPGIRFDNNGKAKVDFWTSDVKSDYEILIQGVSGEGSAFSVKKIIQVK